MDGLQAEALRVALKRKYAAFRYQRIGAAGAVDAGWANAGGGDEVNLRHQYAAAMFWPEKNYPRHQEIEIGRSVSAGKAHIKIGVLAETDQINIGRAVDLPAAEKKSIDAPLCGSIE